MYFLLQFLNFRTAVGVLVVPIFLSYCLLLRRLSRAGDSKTAPEAAGGWPIIGHLHLLGGSDQLPHETLGKMADKCGPVFTIRLGVHRAVVVSSWEMAKECLTVNDQATSSRPELLASKHLGYNYAMFGLAPYGPYWSEMRKITAQELLSNRRLEMLRHIRASEVLTSVQELYRVWTVNESAGLVPVEMTEWFGDLTMNVILRMVTGKRHFRGSGGSENREAQRVYREFTHLVGQFVVGDAIPFLGWLDLGGHKKAMKRTAKEMDIIAQEWLEEHRPRRRKYGSGEDFMDVLMSVLDGKNLGDYDADTINKATCLNIVIGATDTTTVTLTWALSLLLNNRDILRRAQEELDVQIGKERLVNEEDVSKLVYVQAIIKETLRLYPSAPLAGPRQFTEDCSLGAYHVSKGTRLILNVSKIQKDSRIWWKPTEFRPERFLTTTHKDLDPGGQHFEFIPFGAGRRACPGRVFGLQMLHLTLASVLQAFDFSTPSNAQVDMQERFGLTNVKATPLQLLVSPRLSSSAYNEFHK